jgi:hypothetical protein
LGLSSTIEHALKVDKSGSVVLEFILYSTKSNAIVFGQLGLHELSLVGSWYIWWQRREWVKGESVASSSSSAFSIHALLQQILVWWNQKLN